MSNKKIENPSQNQPARTGIEFSRVEDFSELYANNVSIESSLWDLKLVFGQNDQHISPNAVVQHTAITIPWAQAKVLAYSLSLALTDQEARSGRIHLKKGLIGELPKEIPKAVRESAEVSEETWKALRNLYENFVAANPELSPK